MCWTRECCCKLCDKKITKIISYVLSFLFLSGILACCISGFVTANRFGFSLYGIECAYERIYYDSMYGQYKETYPKWEGFKAIADNNIFLNYTLRQIINKKNLSLDFFISPEDLINYYPKDNLKEIKSIIANYFSFPIPQKFVNLIFNKIDENTTKEEANAIGKSIQNLNKKISYGNNNLFQLINKYNFIYQYNNSFLDQIITLNTLANYQNDLIHFKTKFIKDFNFYVNDAMGWGKIVPLIFFSLVLTIVVGLCALLIINLCEINEKYWILPMHFAWNGLRLFIFFFFMYGCAYGMLFLLSRDSIAYLRFAFSKENLLSNDIVILPQKTKEFFKTCLYNNPIYDDFKNNNAINEFIKNYFTFRNWSNNINENDCISDNENVRESCKSLIYELNNNFTINFKNVFEPDDKSLYINYFQSIFERDGNIYDNMNCSFIYNNINLMYRAMWDFAWETRILCALSCCIAFFGEISVLSFLYAMYH